MEFRMKIHIGVDHGITIIIAYVYWQDFIMYSVKISNWRRGSASVIWRDRKITDEMSKNA